MPTLGTLYAATDEELAASSLYVAQLDLADTAARKNLRAPVAQILGLVQDQDPMSGEAISAVLDSYLGGTGWRDPATAGAEIAVYTHTLATGVQSYECAPEGEPAPAAGNVIVHCDGSLLIPGVDYTLAVDGLSITLTSAVVASAPDETQLMAGMALVCVKIAGGLITADVSPGAIGTTELAAEAVTAAKEADGTASSVRVYDADGRPAVITGTNGQYLQFGATGPVAGNGPTAASAAETRAGTSTTKFLTPATAAYAPNAPLFVARWAHAIVNGAMQLTWMQTAIAGNISLSRTSVGRYRLTHPAMTAVPVVTFIAPTATTQPLRALVFPESAGVTIIESWDDAGPVDAGVVVAMYGSLA